MQIKNPCIRCGKERVAVKTWEERVGNSISIHTTNVCPDEACQKIVEEELAARKAKSDLLEQKKVQAKREKVELLMAKKRPLLRK